VQLRVPVDLLDYSAQLCSLPRVGLPCGGILELGKPLGLEQEHANHADDVSMVNEGYRMSPSCIKEALEDHGVTKEGRP